MITVACVLRSGGPYDAEYVERLQAGVAEHLTAPHHFLCLSDVPVPCNRLELRYAWPGWWAKVELFRLLGPVLYFDLDTVIRGNIDALARRVPQGLSMLRDLGAPYRLASGVMTWGDEQRHIVTRFAADPEHYIAEAHTRTLWGDGGHFGRYARLAPGTIQDRHPGLVVSRKYASRQAIDAASVVCFHGTPRPRDVAWRVHE
jgi:hypothetical protein